MRKIKTAISFIMIAAAMLVLTGCGKSTIQGDWVLVKEVDADGTVLNQSELKDLGIAESYHIEDDIVSYTCNLMGKDISFDLELVDNGNNTYDFMFKDLVFASVTLKGDTFTYTVEGGEESDTMYFERVK
ncbi:MAG: hypothetical protein K6G19_10810 [Lachnospiraceae bacterium]|nr:hypothetical protein [Lachnospiraceae bacterium]